MTCAFSRGESCDFRVVRILRAAGHDFQAVSDLSPRAEDSVVIDLAIRESRVLLTEDKDFGRLVYANAQPSGSVIFIRFPAGARKALLKAIRNLVSQQGEQLLGSFATLTPGRVRISRSPR